MLDTARAVCARARAAPASSCALRASKTGSRSMAPRAWKAAASRRDAAAASSAPAQYSACSAAARWPTKAFAGRQFLAPEGDWDVPSGFAKTVDTIPEELIRAGIHTRKFHDLDMTPSRVHPRSPMGAAPIEFPIRHCLRFSLRHSRFFVFQPTRAPEYNRAIKPHVPCFEGITQDGNT